MPRDLRALNVGLLRSRLAFEFLRDHTLADLLEDRKFTEG